MPLILGGGDVLAAAETGSGKTGAFALPLLQAVAEARAGVAGGSSALPRVAHAGGRSEEEEEGGGGGARGEEDSSMIKVSATDRDELLAVSPCGLRAQARSERKWAGARATAGVSLLSAVSAAAGGGGGGEKDEEEKTAEEELVFFEATVRDEGLARVGWSLPSASLDLGTDASGVGFGGSGKLVRSGKFIEFGVGGGEGGFGKGDVVGCALDPKSKKAFFFKNGEPVGVGDAAFADDASAAAAAAVDLPEGIEGGSVLFPAIALKNAEVELNFGADQATKPFAFLPPPSSSEAGARRTFVALAAAAPLLARRGEKEKESAAAPPPPSSSNENQKKKLPLALVLEPLKDLAEQTAGVFESLARYLPSPGVSTLLLVGGASGPLQAEAKAALRAGAADVVVGTLGRVASAVDDGSLDLSGVRFFVLDEADRLVDALNADALFSLAARLQAATAAARGGRGGVVGGSAAATAASAAVGAARLQTLFFSATLHSPRVEAAAARLCPRALRVDLKGAGFVPDSVDHLCVRPDPRADASWLQASPRVPTDGVHAGSSAAALLSQEEGGAGAAAAAALASGNSDGNEGKRKELLSLALKRLKARLFVRVADALRMPRAVVFCRTNHDCVQLARFLSSLTTTAEGGGGALQDEALAAAFKEEEEEGVNEGGGEGEKGGGGGKKHKKRHGASPSSQSSPFLFPSGPYSCAVLGGARTTDERREALQLFREGKVRFLVATDAAARGIDVAGLPYCVNFALPSPENSEDYIHRIGRVGRAGAAGLAVSLVAAQGVEEKVWFVTKKGYKPWEARPPRSADRRLASEGGHCVWMDESESLRAVCERLQGPVQELGEGLELPEGVRARVEATTARAAAGGGGDGGGGASLACYGSVVGDDGMTAAAKVIRERLDELAPAVKKLAELEEDAQTSFFELQTRWGG